MKSKRSLHERINVPKQKLTTTKSQNSISNNHKSLSTSFIKKNLHTLQKYNSLFGGKVSFHIGDADTHFRKTLRRYNEFNYHKNTEWIKVNDTYHSHKHKKITNANLTTKETESEEQFVSPKSELGESDFDPTEWNLDSASNRSSKSSKSFKSSPSSKTDQQSPTNRDVGAGDFETKEDLTKSDQVTGDLLLSESQSQTQSQVDLRSDSFQTTSNSQYQTQSNSQVSMAEEEVGIPEDEEKEGGDAKREEDEEFKKLLDKSLEELKTAVEQLDAEALDEMDDVTKDIKAIKAMAGGERTEQKDLMPIDNKVLAELEQAEIQARNTANVINELKEKVAALMMKEHMTAVEAKELEEMNIELVKHMEDFENKTKLIQALVAFADSHLKKVPELPPIQEKLPEDMLPKVIICGTTENNMPKIIICDTDTKKKKKRSDSPCEHKKPPSLMPPPAAVDGIAKRLSDSYDMQEKLAMDNVDLEGKRFQLQEELLDKDKACEHLQRKVCNLQAEMRILAKENTALNDKLATVQGKCRPRPEMPCGSGQGQGVCPADVENRLQHYSHTTNALEKQVEMMEGEVRKMQEELTLVQRERMEMEQARRMASQQAQPPPQTPQHTCRPTCHGPCRPGAAAEQQLRELREQYNRLQDDYKAKLTEVAGLRADNEKLKCHCNEMDGHKRQAEMQAKDLEEQMRKNDQERNKLLGSKEQLIEQEQQLTVAKQRFREAQDELEELRALIGDQASQLEDYRNKYLQAQQQVEEQRRQIDVMEMENNRVSEQVTMEIQRVKNQFQEKLAELSPLPDILKTTQLKVQEEQQVRMLAERNAEALSRELQMMKEKEHALLSEMDKVRNDQQMGDDERNHLETKVKGWECRCNDMQQNCEKLKTDLVRAEEMASQNEKRLDEKLHEVVQLTSQLESVREESARQVARTKDRCETVRRSMQGQIADLERQLAQARAMARSAQKDRDEIRQKMQAQINNLNENFEEAQLRIRSLQGHVNFLKTSYTTMFGGTGQEGTGDDACDCGSYA